MHRIHPGRLRKRQVGRLHLTVNQATARPLTHTFFNSKIGFEVFRQDHNHERLDKPFEIMWRGDLYQPSARD